VLRPPPARFRFALPRPEDRRFFGNRDSERLFDAAIQRLVSLGGDPVEVDFQPLAAAAAVLYSPPGVAERTAAIETFLSERPDALLPVTRGIIAAGAAARAVDLHRARDKLRAARRVAEQLFAQTDCLLVPTAGTIYRIAEVEAEPLALNTNLGSYTNFVNQLDLAALAVPAGFQSDGLPFGVTLIGLAHREAELAAIGDALHRVSTLTLGASGEKLPPPRYDESAASYPTVDLVVFGAHLTGEPLNPELMALGGRFVGACRTAPRYRLFHIVDGGPSRPGLVRQRDGGTAIGGEIWRLPTDGFGAFVAQVKAPLAIGTVELDDGRRVKGFVCEGHAVDGAEDISAFGDWRRYRASTRSGSAAAAT
jgi:allophanate hydrolase